ncbi:hypothetical protein MLD38_002025 [Melastoma candidum]|uniref:Uncharacterized protein n=1 Tax=Melastoma candidum TaxID=119954 RepID=A0ACB9SF47_9MYRT|nr:hypothetical protein MLD38_002025 [Melastoma candidum]
MAPSFDWWSKDVHKGTPVVVKMENPNWSMVELEGPTYEDLFVGEGGTAALDSPDHRHHRRRNKNAKQLTWVLLLKAHRAAGCLASIAAAAVALSSAVRRRVSSAGQTLIWRMRVLRVGRRRTRP